MAGLIGDGRFFSIKIGECDIIKKRFVGGEKMRTKDELKEIIRIMADTYYQIFGDAIEQILLYGSYARGDNTVDSDIDLVAIVRGDRQTLQNKLKQVWDVSSDLELQYDVIISPTVIPYDEYIKYKEDVPYYRNIQKEGVNIVA
jgi:predicted nucleotidyltransferase